jgi:DNA-binding NtrC family response regulator
VRTRAFRGRGLELIRQKAPAFAVVDMRLEDGNGLDVIAELRQAAPQARTIVLTGYGNIATAVSAVKLGAVDYLAKPADADDVTDALLARTTKRRARRRTRCRPTACAGSTSSASMSCATATSRRPRAGSTCIGAPAAHSRQARTQVKSGCPRA